MTAHPHNEADRLAALNRYQILDTAPEAEFDDICQLASYICQAPVAMVSMVDAGRQWFKSRVGLDVAETPRAGSFCDHALHGEGVFEVPNALEDHRFVHHPAVVGDAQLRFYAGAPLMTDDGHSIGTLCVMDKLPRQLLPAQKTALTALARQVVRQLESRLLIAREQSLNLKLASQARFQKVLLGSAMVAVIAITDHGLVASFNPSAETLLGYKADEVIGRQPVSFFHVEEELQARARELGAELGRDLSGLESLLTRARMGQPETREWHYRRSNGTLVPVMASIAALSDDDGAAGGFVVLAWDITERRQARERIVRINAELERRVSARTAELQRTTDDLQMLSQSLAHDLRQPLISISGYSSLLMQEVTSERGHHYLRRVTAGIAQINLRADALLYFANLAHLPLKRQEVDLRKIALGYFNALQAAAPQRRVRTVVQEELQAFGDPALLRELLQELLDNAWRFTASQPQAILEVGSSTGADGECVYHVRDNGAGFDMRYADGLFDPFQRLESGDDEGEGIGLARVKRIVMKHGGRVWAESIPGQGASFYFTIRPVEL